MLRFHVSTYVIELRDSTCGQIYVSVKISLVSRVQYDHGSIIYDGYDTASVHHEDFFFEGERRKF